MRALAAVAFLLALLAVAAPADAVIRPQKGMAGVRIGMTDAQVRAVLGEPGHTRRGRNDFSEFTELQYRGGLRVFFQGNQDVTSISTTGRSERTARGAGVGSSERFVLRNVGHSRCDTFFGFRTCHVGSFRAGTRVTDFQIRRGRVTRVVVGIVID